MSDTRPSFSISQQTTLLAQVMNVCPLCDTPLFYQKGGKTYKKYEIAHIYPFSPTPEEKILLASEIRLSEDVNDEDNLIPLCVESHTIFDKPRTVEGYRELVAIKQELIKRSVQQALVTQYQIEQDVRKVIEKLYDSNSGEKIELEMEPKEVDKKLVGKISNLTKQKIRNYVSNYFPLIKREFAAIDALNPESANLIASQVKTFYLRQKKEQLSQQEIFQNLVSWIDTKTQPETIEAAEIIISFFIQNCEVFE